MSYFIEREPKKSIQTYLLWKIKIPSERVNENTYVPVIQAQQIWPKIQIIENCTFRQI
jgi:hypothetical protein